MTDLDDALADLGPLKPGDKPNYAKTAKKFGVDRTTLSRRHRGVTSDRKDGYAQQQHLTP